MNSTFNYIAGGTLLRRQVVHFYSGLDIHILEFFLL
jgi:hypothetical protein